MANKNSYISFQNNIDSDNEYGFGSDYENENNIETVILTKNQVLLNHKKFCDQWECYYPGCGGGIKRGNIKMLKLYK